MSNPATAAPQSTPDNKSNVSNDTEYTPEVAADFGSSLTTASPLTPKDVLQLQRAIGNRATTQLISKQPRPTVQREGDPPVRPAGTAPAARPSVEVPSWQTFYQQIQASAIAPGQISIHPGVQTSKAELAQHRDEVLKEVRELYQTCDRFPMLTNFVKLYHKLDWWLVMYWDNQLLRQAGFRTDGVKAVFNTTKETIEKKVKLEIGRTGANAADATGVLKDGGKKGKESQKYAFFEAVGVPAEFYSKLSKKQVELFRELYQRLLTNDTKAIPGIIAKLTDQKIVGFPLIKGLFLTKFPQAAGLANLQSNTYQSTSQTKEAAYASTIGTRNMFGGLTPQEMQDEAYAGDYSEKRATLETHLRGKTVSKNLTNAELAALSEYTGGKFNELNAQLRGNDTGAPQGSPAFQKQSEERRNRSEVIVSALNKLPAYTGIAYRMQNGWADFDEAVKPGGMFTDLAFMSASMTVEGAEIGGASGGAGKPGALEVYEIIRASSARKVTILSLASPETEVLFPPGVRFKVKAIWKHINGRIPKDAPMEAQMILMRNGETKKKTDITGTYTGTVRVVELVEG